MQQRDPSHTQLAVPIQARLPSSQQGRLDGCLKLPQDVLLRLLEAILDVSLPIADGTWMSFYRAKEDVSRA